MEKNKVTQDFLYKFITERGVNISTLAEQMGLSVTMVNGCFRHNKDKNGSFGIGSSDAWLFNFIW